MSRSRLVLAVVLAGALGVAACSAKDSTGTSAGAPATTIGPATTAGRGGTGATPGATTGAAGPATSNGSGPVANAGPVAKYAGFDDPTYARGENWLCGAGAASDDRCLKENLDVTVVKGDGSTAKQPSTPATAPAFDCFYVYPTVNLTQGAGNDEAMAADAKAEEAVLRNQASRLRELCRVYAPLYRQNTLAGYASPDVQTYLDKAYGDVRNAWRQYMAHWNDGRPVLLLGHSQGSGHLLQLLEDEFDNDPDMRARLVSAILAGGWTEVPPGKDVGGSFANIPACSAPGQTGCVIGFNSVAVGDPTGDRKRWGNARTAGMQRLCTNPGALGSAASGTLDPVVPDQAGAYGTPFVSYPGALTAQCDSADGSTTLDIGVTPGDRRDVAELVKPIPNWGLHINEVNLTMGNLLTLARAQAATIR